MSFRDRLSCLFSQKRLEGENRRYYAAKSDQSRRKPANFHQTCFDFASKECSAWERFDARRH